MQEKPIAGLSFDGLRPWEPDYPNIECEAQGRIFDLHNCARFLGYTFAADGTLTFAWHHYEGWDTTRHPELVVLRFAGVRHLSAAQAEDWDTRCGDDTEEWYYEPHESGGALLRFEIADSFLEFCADAVGFEVRPAPPPT